MQAREYGPVNISGTSELSGIDLCQVMSVEILILNQEIEKLKSFIELKNSALTLQLSKQSQLSSEASVNGLHSFVTSLREKQNLPSISAVVSSEFAAPASPIAHEIFLPFEQKSTFLSELPPSFDPSCEMSVTSESNELSVSQRAPSPSIALAVENDKKPQPSSSAVIPTRSPPPLLIEKSSVIDQAADKRSSVTSSVIPKPPAAVGKRPSSAMPVSRISVAQREQRTSGDAELVQHVLNASNPAFVHPPIKAASVKLLSDQVVKRNNADVSSAQTANAAIAYPVQVEKKGMVSRLAGLFSRPITPKFQETGKQATATASSSFQPARN